MFSSRTDVCVQKEPLTENAEFESYLQGDGSVCPVSLAFQRRLFSSVAGWGKNLPDLDQND